MTPATVDFLKHHQPRLLPYGKDGAEDYNLSSVHKRILGLETNDLEGQLREISQSMVNATDTFGKTPLLYACRRGDLEAVKWLIENKADVNKSDSMRRSPLHMAARSGSPSIIELLLEAKADPMAANLLNEIPAHYACYEENSAQLAKPLIDAGSDVNLLSKYGRTMLDIAVQFDYPDLVRYLIESGAKTEGPEPIKWDLSPLGRAILCKSHSALRTLIVERVKMDSVNTDKENILHFLARHGDRATIEEFTSCEHLQLNIESANAKNMNAEQPYDIARTRADIEFVIAFERLLRSVRERSNFQASQQNRNQ